jgi:outer membrane protein TolC
MRHRHLLLLLLSLPALTTASLSAQERLTLSDAIARATEANPAVRAAAEAVHAAEAGTDEARAGWLPRVDYVESWQRSNQPVFVFGSLLAQSRFGPENFAIDALNHPDPVTNTRGVLLVQQTLFDGAQGARVRGAGLTRDVALLGAAAAQRELALATTRAYGRVLTAAAARRAADAALQTADEDRRRAASRRDAGMATDADVLAFDVHLAAMKSRVLQAAGDERVARAVLNDVIGAPLDAGFDLDEVVPGGAGSERPPVDTLEQEAVRRRESARQAQLRESLAAVGRSQARAAFLPQVAFQGGWEFDGKDWSGRERWWMAGVELRLNLFSGLADRARLRAARSGVARAMAEREQAENAVRLDVRTALAHLDSARAREDVGRAAVAQAREAQRIIRERYESGLAGLADVLRAANALLDAELQRVSAVVDVFVGEATLNWALGR